MDHNLDQTQTKFHGSQQLLDLNIVSNMAKSHSDQDYRFYEIFPSFLF